MNQLLDGQTLLHLLITYGGRILLAIVVLVLGLKLIKWLEEHLGNRLRKMEIEPSLLSFLLSFSSLTLKALLFISVAGMLGIEMTSFLTIIGALSFAIGLAFQGSLSNFAGGVLILILKPFKVGDFIEANGYKGTVRAIQIFYTILSTPDNKKIIIPNASLSNSSAINYSAYDTRRVDFKFSVDYKEDIKKVKALLKRLAEEHPLVLKDREPFVVLGEHGDNGLILYLRVWCDASDYWKLYYDLIEQVKEEFDREDISIPFHQLDVHMRES